MAALSPEILLAAYCSGIFPMSDDRDDPEIFWVDPLLRGVIPLDGFRISRSLARRLKRDDYRVTLDTAFEQVIDCCAERDRTWINQTIRSGFVELHAQGYAHSIEVWDQDGSLIGGVYGLAIGGAFFGESMFSRRTDGSKIALSWLVSHLRACGFMLFDTQFLTDHLASLGAEEIHKDLYVKRLDQALEVEADIYALPLPQNGQVVVQRNTQTS
jgi:leucyl/phenylalanyl-tRNA--protein transferase